MDYSQKLQIARWAYRDIKVAIERWENDYKHIQVLAHWDECITVDDELFHGYQLRQKDGE